MRKLGPFLWRYGVAAVSTLLVAVLTLLLQPYLRHGVMVIFFASVMISAWVGGLGPGLLASVLSMLATRYLFFPPIYSFEVYSSDDSAQLVVFFIVTILISSLTHTQKRTVVALTKSQEELKALADALELRVRERTAGLTLLYEISRTANEMETLGQALRFVAKKLCDDGLFTTLTVFVPNGEASSLVSSFSYSGSGTSTEASPQTDRTVRSGEGAVGLALQKGTVETGPAEVLAFPVVSEGEVLAVFECRAKEPLLNVEYLLRLMSAISLELGRVAGRRRLQEEYTDAVWQQQVRIAHELHDGLGQELTGLGFLSKSLVRSMEGNPAVTTALQIGEGIQHSLEQIRGLAQGVMPVEREPEGLMSALRQLAAMQESIHGVTCRFDCPNPVLLADHHAASQLYRIAQEATTNAFKHAKAAVVTIALENKGKDLVLKVADDGGGISASVEKRPAGSGLRIMMYRAVSLGATLTVRNADPRGTEVVCRLPLPESEATEQGVDMIPGSKMRNP